MSPFKNESILFCSNIVVFINIFDLFWQVADIGWCTQVFLSCIVCKFNMLEYVEVVWKRL
jgi:hypothetical protein